MSARKQVIVGMLLVVSLLMPAVVAAQAVHERTEERVWQEGSGFAPCAMGGEGEMISFGGWINVRTNVTIDSENGLHFAQVWVPDGFTGVGLTSGTRYDGRGEASVSMHVSDPDFPYTFTLTNNFVLIGRGSEGAKIIDRITYHVTINAEGEVTTEFLRHTIKCGIQ